jgi:DNA (cytosine-5)-methyltransferase 1
MKPTFYEFFAGGGMARAGLEPDWRCLFANDIDPKKAETYVANWGDKEFHLGDIFALKVEQLQGEADLAWASFPCQDLSLAGNGGGLDAARSGAFWGFHDLMYGLKARGRAPKLIVLENVVGTVTSNGGRDFETLCRALKGLGYVYGALIIDAVHFVPQSRPRLFILGLRSDLDDLSAAHCGGPSSLWATDTLKHAYTRLRPDLQKAWRWWRLRAPSIRNIQLADLMLDEPADVTWHAAEETSRLLSMMSASNLAKVESAKRDGRRVVGTIYRRTRRNELGEKAQRAEVRFDNVSGCLRTPAGGSSRQTVIVVEGERVRTRLLSAREAARLMDLPDEYVLPPKYNDAYHLVGDGVVTSAVKHLATYLLMPLCSNISLLDAAE